MSESVACALQSVNEEGTRETSKRIQSAADIIQRIQSAADTVQRIQPAVDIIQRI